MWLTIMQWKWSVKESKYKTEKKFDQQKYVKWKYWWVRNWDMFWACTTTLIFIDIAPLTLKVSGIATVRFRYEKFQ